MQIKLNHCGIPIKTWLYTYIIIFTLKTLFQFYFESGRKRILFRAMFIDGFLISWLLYGNILFFSEHNHCSLYRQTFYLNVLMAFIVVFSFMPILMFVINILTTFLPLEINDYLDFNHKFELFLDILSYCSRIEYINFNDE